MEEAELKRLLAFGLVLIGVYCLDKSVFQAILPDGIEFRPSIKMKGTT
jgi:hypothetical protein